MPQSASVTRNTNSGIAVIATGGTYTVTSGTFAAGVHVAARARDRRRGKHERQLGDDDRDDRHDSTDRDDQPGGGSEPTPRLLRPSTHDWFTETTAWLVANTGRSRARRIATSVVVTGSGHGLTRSRCPA